VKTSAIIGIMLDWAGTTVDHGSIAPVLALQSLFQLHGITLSTDDARRDMGLLKRDHIRAILSLPNIQEDWRAANGHLPGEAEVDTLFAEFGPLQMRVITQNSRLIPGVADTVRSWQQRGIRIGSSTGYTRAMLAPVLEQAAHEGYRPDASVCPDEAGAGRPAPWMLMRNAQMLNVYPLSRCVKIGDTVSDIEEGRNAGMWTIGITRTGNMIGVDEEGWKCLAESEKQSRLKEAGEILLAAGADFIAEDLAACDSILAVIEERLRAEECNRRLG
jgi:phosphonoacetaldehyde hydrolase